MIKDKAPKPKNPVMIDRVLAYLQDSLVENIGWLDYAFGRAQRLVTRIEHKDHYYPGVYKGGNEYLNVLPGQGLGNRTFFTIDDPHTVEFNPRRYNTIRSPFSLVLWYDVRTILGASETIYYTMAVYYGSLKIKNTRHTLTCAMISHIVGVIASVFICYIIFT